MTARDRKKRTEIAAAPLRAGDSFAHRLSYFGGLVCRMVANLPDTREGRHLADQLLRSATAPGAHYAEARGAQSRKDFIYKLSLALKEMRESLHWLRVAESAGWGFEDFDEVVDEGEQLVRMLHASKETAQRGKGG